jgi:hypothetical protein
VCSSFVINAFMADVEIYRTLTKSFNCIVRMQ